MKQNGNGKMFASAVAVLNRARKDVGAVAKKGKKGVSAKERHVWEAIERQIARAQTRVRSIARKAA